MSRLRVDILVSPFSLVMEPDNNHIEEGGKISVTCTASQAKPAAFIYWNSDPKFEQLEEQEQVVESGNTFTTISKVSDSLLIVYNVHRFSIFLSQAFAAKRILKENIKSIFLLPHSSV